MQSPHASCSLCAPGMAERACESGMYGDPDTNEGHQVSTRRSTHAVPAAQCSTASTIPVRLDGCSGTSIGWLVLWLGTSLRTQPRWVLLGTFRLPLWLPVSWAHFSGLKKRDMAAWPGCGSPRLIPGSSLHTSTASQALPPQAFIQHEIDCCLACLSGHG